MNAKIRPQATSKRLVETDRTIVTEWRFAPGAETGWYRHAHDYLVVVLTAAEIESSLRAKAMHAESPSAARLLAQAM